MPSTSPMILSFLNKSKYWELYKDLYPIITEKGGGRFPQMFGEEFVKAYERQVAEYQRHDRQGSQAAANSEIAAKPVDDPDLMTTQKLDASQLPRESQFENENAVDSLAETGANEIDRSFIDELEDSLSREVSKDQLKA